MVKRLYNLITVIIYLNAYMLDWYSSLKLFKNRVFEKTVLNKSEV